MFSEKLKSLRKESGFSQDKFAKVFKIPLSTYCHWEQGKSEPKEYFQETILFCYRYYLNQLKK